MALAGGSPCQRVTALCAPVGLWGEEVLGCLLSAGNRSGVCRLASGNDRGGVPHSGGAFPSKSAARAHYRDEIEPGLTGRPSPRRDLTFAELVETFLERHGKVTTPRTIRTLRERLRRPLKTFGEVPLADLEGMSDDVAAFVLTLPDRFRHPVMLSFRQALEAGIRYGYMTRNPAKMVRPNPTPPPRAVRVFTPEELASVTEELDGRGAAAARFAAATGLRPSEWANLERRDVDRTRSTITVRGTKTLRHAERSHSRKLLSMRSGHSPQGSIRSTSSLRSAAGRSTSRTSASASGDPQ